MTLENIDSDLERFSKSQIWPRILGVEKESYLVFPFKGEQIISQYNIPENFDTDGWHWHFVEESKIEQIPYSGYAKEYIMKNPVKFNCFLRGHEENGILRGESQISHAELEILIERYNNEYGYSQLENIWDTERVVQLSIAKVIMTKIYYFLKENKHLKDGKKPKKTVRIIRKLSKPNLQE